MAEYSDTPRITEDIRKIKQAIETIQLGPEGEEIKEKLLGYLTLVNMDQNVFYVEHVSDLTH